jgi:hypothetical protein
MWLFFGDSTVSAAVGGFGAMDSSAYYLQVAQTRTQAEKDSSFRHPELARGMRIVVEVLDG